MRKSSVKADNNNLRPEYDLTKLGKGVRGKYYERARAGTNLVLIEPDLMKAFPDARSVNRALRGLVRTAKGSPPHSRRTKTRLMVGKGSKSR